MSSVQILPSAHSGDEKGSFAYDTIKDRMPTILAKVIDTIHRNKDTIIQDFICQKGLTEDCKESLNDEVKSALHELGRLRHELTTDKGLQSIQDGRLDCPLWASFYKEQEERLGAPPSPYSAPWLYVECHMYRAINEILLNTASGEKAVNGAKGLLLTYDPFGDQKNAGFFSSMSAMVSLMSYLRKEGEGQTALQGARQSLDKAKAALDTADVAMTKVEESMLRGSSALENLAQTMTEQMVKGAVATSASSLAGTAQESDQKTQGGDNSAVSKDGQSESGPGDSTMDSLLDSAERGRKLLLQKMVELSLWGNKCDLSISAGADNYQQANPLDQVDLLRKDILINDFQSMWDQVFKHTYGKPNTNIALVLDNAGFELVTDLCLAEMLLSYGVTQKVTLHGKAMPWFVSDTTQQDLDWTLDSLQRADNLDAQHFGLLWKQRLADKTMVLETHPFWTLPHDYARMQEVAPDLHHQLSESNMIIFKGDLNYRKLVGDLRWNMTDSFEAALRGFEPAPLMALRTAKADLMLGLTKEQEETIDQLEGVNMQGGDNSESGKGYRKWVVSGKYGVIQCHIKSK